MPQQQRIAIVGTGPGGLIAARILHLHGIEVTVFERDAHATSRTQGGSLDMHRESGQFAIRCAGLSAEFARIARYDDQETRVYDKDGKLRFQETGSEGDRPEVDRTQLREVLLQSLPEGGIRWGHELRGTALQDDGAVALTFADGGVETFDLVIGADGAWSRIRSLVSDARPVYSGVTFVELNFADVEATDPEIAGLVGHGMMFALGDGKALIGHRDAGTRVTMYAGLRVAEDWSAKGGLDHSSLEATRSGVAAAFTGWSETLLQVIRRCPEELTPRPIYALPVGHRWEHRSGVTLVGDAAHLMSPFSGEGANLAMQDGADLALELASAGRDWDAAVRRFEAKMFARAEAAASGARDGIDEVFSDDGLEHVLRHMQEQLGPG